MDSRSRQLLESIVNPAGGQAPAPQDAPPATSFTIEQIVNPRGPIVRVDAAVIAREPAEA